jgi:hypothetical protein
VILATQEDVEARLGRSLDSSEEDRLDGLLVEASALVEGYLGVVYDDDPDTDNPETTQCGCGCGFEDRRSCFHSIDCGGAGLTDGRPLLSDLPRQHVSVVVEG